MSIGKHCRHIAWLSAAWIVPVANTAIPQQVDPRRLEQTMDQLRWGVSLSVSNQNQLLHLFCQVIMA